MFYTSIPFHLPQCPSPPLPSLRISKANRYGRNKTFNKWPPYSPWLHQLNIREKIEKMPFNLYYLSLQIPINTPVTSSQPLIQPHTDRRRRPKPSSPTSSFQTPLPIFFPSRIRTLLFASTSLPSRSERTSVYRQLITRCQSRTLLLPIFHPHLKMQFPTALTW